LQSYHGYMPFLIEKHVCACYRHTLPFVVFPCQPLYDLAIPTIYRAKTFVIVGEAHRSFDPSMENVGSAPILVFRSLNCFSMNSC